MIPRMGILAAAASVGLHVAGFGIGAGGSDAVEMAGRQGGEIAALGNSFADMAAGRLAPVQALDATAEATPQVTAPVAPDTMKADAIVMEMAPVPATPQPTRVEAALAAPVTPERSTPPTQVASAPVAPVQPVATSGPPAITPTVRPSQLVPSSEAEATPSSQPTANKPPEAAPKAPPPSELAVAKAPKPESRPVEPQVTRRAPEARLAEEPARAEARGNAGQDARKGQANGSAGATAASAGRSATATTTGTGKVDNYPGIVMREIQKTRRERAGERGSAVVGFVIAPSGQVGAVQILKSSGSPRVDQVALDHIRRAAPFPPPPPNAKVQYSIEVNSPG
jgi:protein TonB